MKIRTDFVTNSSSSNYTVEIEIRSADGSVCLTEDPSERDRDSGEAVFNGDLRDINTHLSSVKELATWLARSTEPDWGDRDAAYFQRKRSRFVNDACSTFKSVRDIASITVTRQYDAWGEFADLVADSDSRLIELAEIYMKSSGMAKNRAAAEMITHIQTVDDARGESFGCGCAISRFQWNGKSLDKLAKRLCSDYGPNRVSGVERKHLDLKTGEYFDTSDFDLM